MIARSKALPILAVLEWQPSCLLWLHACHRLIWVLLVIPSLLLYATLFIYNSSILARRFVSWLLLLAQLGRAISNSLF
jgi:hypothetical protein